MTEVAKEERSSNEPMSETIVDKEAFTRELAARAKQRRVQMGKTCRELAESVPGLTVARVMAWEQRIPYRFRPDESLWEQALQVPPGWLRDLSMATPDPTAGQPKGEDPGEPVGELSLLDIAAGTVAHEIAATYVYGAFWPFGTLGDLTATRQRKVTIALCTAGVFGVAAKSYKFLQAHFDRSEERIRYIEKSVEVSVQRGAAKLGVPVLENLALAIQAHLPASGSMLDSLMRSELGCGLTMVDADRFARQCLGRSPFNVVYFQGSALFLPPAVSEGDVVTVRGHAQSVIRRDGAAQIEEVFSSAMRTLPAACTSKCIRLILTAMEDFRWLDEQTGWFWFGPSVDNVVGRMASLLTSAAGSILHLDDIRRACADAAIRHDAFPKLPREVFASILAAWPETTQVGDSYFKAVHAVPVDRMLSKAEHAVLLALKDGQGATSIVELDKRLVATGVMSRGCLTGILTSCPIFTELPGKMWGVRGLVPDQSTSFKPLSEAQSLTLGARAARRREHLGLTLLDLAVQTGIGAGKLSKMESSLPSLRSEVDESWERALQVPDGWLRDLVTGSDVDLSRKVSPLAAQFRPNTVAHEIASLLCSAMARNPKERERLTALEAEIMAFRCGLYGHHESKYYVIAKKFGVDQRRGRAVHARVMTVFGASEWSTPLVDALAARSVPHLPMSLREFDLRYRSKLGGRLTAASLANACRDLFGRSIFRIETHQHAALVCPPGLGSRELRQVRSEVAGFVRSCGAAQIDWVAGALSAALQRAVTAVDARQWCQLLDGFEWIDEHTGWFWLGSSYGPQQSMRQTVVKVLAVAAAPVKLPELLGAIARIQTCHPSAKYAHQFRPEAPADVVRTILARLPEIEVIQEGVRVGYRLREPVALEEVLTAGELAAYRILSQNGGVMSSAALVATLQSGAFNVKAIHPVQASVIINSLDRGVVQLRGHRIDPERYQQALGERNPRKRKAVGVDHSSSAAGRQQPTPATPSFQGNQ